MVKETFERVRDEEVERIEKGYTRKEKTLLGERRRNHPTAKREREGDNGVRVLDQG